MRRPPPVGRRARTRSARPDLEALEGRQLLATFTVTNVNDSGPGSLRQAILATYVAQSTSTIAFAIPGPGVHTIAPLTPLPRIGGPVAVDGTSQPGYAGSPLIRLDGRDAIPPPAPIPPGGPPVSPTGGVDGLFFGGGAGGSVRGLAIGGFSGNGIEVTFNSRGVTIQGNEIGVGPDGETATGNLEGGILIDGSLAGAAGNTIGGMSAGAGNLISGNGPTTSGGGPSRQYTSGDGSGVVVNRSDGNSIAGNVIGTDASLAADLGNFRDGIFLGGSGSGNIVASNVLAHNGGEGIADAGFNNVISGNRDLGNRTRLADLVVQASTSEVKAVTGQILTLAYTISNRGPQVATGVQFNILNLNLFADFDPSHPVAQDQFLKVVSASSTQGTTPPGFVLEDLQPQVKLGTLAPGASATVTLSLLDLGPGSEPLRATATSDQFLPFPLSNNTTITLVNSTDPIDLAVSAVPPPSPVKVGEPTTFTFTVTNHGPATDARVALDLGGFFGIAPASVVASQGTLAPLADRPSIDTGDLGILAAGASATISVVVIPSRSGAIGADLSAIAADGTDRDLADNLAYANTFALLSPRVREASLRASRGLVDAVRVSFDAPLVDAQAEDARNYRLTTPGRDGRSRRRLDIRSVEYRPKDHTVQLRLSQPLSRVGPPVRLVVAGPGSTGLSAPDGSQLDGGSYTATLRRP